MFPPKTKPRPEISRKPLPVGTWTTGYNVRGLFGFPDHRHGGCIFEVLGGYSKSEFSNAGYRQTAKCITCVTTFTSVDGEFLQVPVDRAYIEKSLAVVTSARARLRKVAQRMQKELAASPE